MPTIDVIIPGERTLDQIETNIATEEAVGYHFLRAAVAARDGRPANVATFEDQGFNRPTRRLELTVKAAGLGDPKPEWEGEMCVQDKLVRVRAFRSG